MPLSCSLGFPRLGQDKKVFLAEQEGSTHGALPTASVLDVLIRIVVFFFFLILKSVCRAWYNEVGLVNQGAYSEYQEDQKK